MEMNQADDQMLLSSNSCMHQTRMEPDSGKRVRRRRRKGQGEGECGGKRRLSVQQLKLLEMNFRSEPKLVSARKVRLASEVGLDPKQVSVWFQNRRARSKSKKLEEEYRRLKNAHENVVIHKCQLESEIMKLKEKLSECETEIRKLSVKLDPISGVQGSCGPGCFLSMDAHQPYLGQFGVEELDNWPYITENIYINGLEWFDLYA